MDVNGTRFHLLLGASDWSCCDDAEGVPLSLSGSPPGGEENLAWDGQRNELTLAPNRYTPPADPLATPLPLISRRGAGSDSFGNWYWIGPDLRSVLVQSAGDGSVSTFWPAGEGCDDGDSRFGEFADRVTPAAPMSALLGGAAVTADHFLVVGRLEPPGLLVFDLTGGGEPTELPWPIEAPFVPFDMAPRRGGGVFILDQANRRVWELDRHFHVIPAAVPALPGPELGGFAAADSSGSEGQSPPSAEPGRAGLSVGAATSVDPGAVSVETGPLAAGVDPSAPTDDTQAQCFLTLSPDATGRSEIAAYAAGSAIGAAVSIGFTGYDLALADPTLFVASDLGEQSYAFGVGFDGRQLGLTLRLDFYPMREFGGKGLVAAGGGPYYDFGERWIPLVDQSRPRYAESGTVRTPVFDGAEPGCVWHRLMLDAIVPPGTGLAVQTRASDDRAALPFIGWAAEPAPQPRRTGPELPFVDPGPYGTHELLFQRAQGRYLQVALQMTGNGRATPRLRALRAWYPRFSYLERYLPKVYRQDSGSASFLDHYLANLEGFYTAIEDRIADVQVLMDPSAAPAADLAWLASWFDLALDPLWDENRRRLLLSNASAFFQARGTIRGVSLALRFVLDRSVDAGAFAIPQPPALSAPRIVEAYRSRSTPGVVFGDPSDQGTPRVVVPTPGWTPAQGRDVLIAGWLQFLDQQGLTDAWVAAEDSGFPIADPGGELSAPWSSFSLAALGFVPSAPDPVLWSAFVSRRYGAVAAAAAAAAAPTVLPADGPALLDWFQFESVLIPMKAKAHRFTVLLPWPLTVADGQGGHLDQSQLRALASRVVDLQKPAHTVYQVKFFWAAFRIGDARIGDDTLLAHGSRVPELVSAAVLGRDYVGETWLAGPAATDTIDRMRSLNALRDTGEESQ